MKNGSTNFNYRLPQVVDRFCARVSLGLQRDGPDVVLLGEVETRGDQGTEIRLSGNFMYNY
jgi:hypothetical protein